MLSTTAGLLVLSLASAVYAQSVPTGTLLLSIPEYETDVLTAESCLPAMLELCGEIGEDEVYLMRMCLDKHVHDLSGRCVEYLFEERPTIVESCYSELMQYCNDENEVSTEKEAVTCLQSQDAEQFSWRCQNSVSVLSQTSNDHADLANALGVPWQEMDDDFSLDLTIDDASLEDDSIVDKDNMSIDADDMWRSDDWNNTDDANKIGLLEKVDCSGAPCSLPSDSACSQQFNFFAALELVLSFFVPAPTTPETGHANLRSRST